MFFIKQVLHVYSLITFINLILRGFLFLVVWSCCVIRVVSHPYPGVDLVV